MRRTTLLRSVGCVFMAIVASAAGAQFGYFIDSDGSNNLWRLDLTNGVSTLIGPPGFSQIEALAFSPGGVLYGVDDTTNTLVTINTTTGAATAVGAGVGNLLGNGFGGSDLGLTWDSSGNLWLTTEVAPSFWSVDSVTGTATLVGAQAQAVTGLTSCGSALFGLGGNGSNNLVRVNPTTGAVTPIGGLVNVSVPDDGAIAYGPDQLYGIVDASPSVLFSIDASTGVATVIADVNDGGSDINGIEGMAIGPPNICMAQVPTTGPTGLVLLMGALAVFGLVALRRLS